MVYKKESVVNNFDAKVNKKKIAIVLQTEKTFCIPSEMSKIVCLSVITNKIFKYLRINAVYVNRIKLFRLDHVPMFSALKPTPTTSDNNHCFDTFRLWKKNMKSKLVDTPTQNKVLHIMFACTLVAHRWQKSYRLKMQTPKSVQVYIAKFIQHLHFNAGPKH